MIVFIAKYPSDDERKEGMAQRVYAVDKFFEQDQRIYLNISFFQNRHLQKSVISDFCSIYNCNIFLHFLEISNLLKQANVLYIHSIINFLRIFLGFWIVPKKCNVVLDAHGLVPEETSFQGKKTLAFCYNFTERILFKRVDTVICVTHAMSRFYKSKYPNISPIYIRYSILPSHIREGSYVPDFAEKSEQINIVYCGNLQKWQNVDLILAIIKAYLANDKIQFFILTNEVAKFNQLLKVSQIPLDNIVVKTVAPYELEDYYKMAHFGIILRDDIALNRASCPTKIIEYLYYGITPVVKLKEIGDFCDMGYEFVDYNDDLGIISTRKSMRNHQIVMKLIQENEQVDLRKVILS